MNPPGVRKPHDLSPQTDPVPEAAAERPEGRHRWVPPVVALLLFLLALSSLWLWLPLPISNEAGAAHANTGGGPGTGGGLGAHEDGPGTTNTGDATGSAEQRGGRGHPAPVEDDRAGHDTDRGAVKDDATTEAREATAEPAATPRPSTDSPLAAELGFATDLSALDADVPRQPATTPDATATPLAGATGDAAGRGGGHEGLASFFGQPGHGSRFVFILDKSGSMQGGAFADARFELIRSLRSLRPHESFYVIFYDSDAEPMPAPGLVPATAKNIERYVDWVRTVSTGGGTDPTEALTTALTRLRPDTIWLLSDGSFNVGVTETITRHNPGRRVHINTLAFRNRVGETVLKIIADENKGDYRFVGP